MIKFQVALIHYGAGRGIVVPPEVAGQLGLRGQPQVSAVIAGIPYRGSLRAMGDGTFGLGVLKAIEQEKGLRIGDVITVELELDTAPRTVEVPRDLEAALGRNARAARAWERLSYTDRREIARSLLQAKEPETRERRLAAALEKLSAP